MDLLQKHFDIALETPDGIKKLRSLILTLAMQRKLVPPELESQTSTNGGSDGKQTLKNHAPVKLGSVLSFNYGKGVPKKDIADSGVPVYGANGPIKFARNSLLDRPAIIVGRKGSAGAINIVEQPSWPSDVTYYVQPPAYMDFRFTYFLLIQLNLPLMAKGIKPGLNRNEVYERLITIPPLAEQERIVAKIDQLMALCDKLEAERNARDQKRVTVHTAAMNRLLSAPDKPIYDSSWQFITKHFIELYSATPNVAELKKAILQLAVMGRLVPQDPNEQPASELLKEIEAEKARLLKEGILEADDIHPPVQPSETKLQLPGTWIWCRYSDVAKLKHGHQFREYDFVPTGIPVIKITQCKADGTLDLTKCDFIAQNRKDEFRNFRIEKGDLLMALTGGTLGKVTRVTEDYGFVVQNYRVGKFIPNGKYIAADYLTIILQSNLFQDLVKGKINQNAQPNVGKADIEYLPIPLPPLAEQQLIVAKVDQLMALCDALEKHIGAATEKKTAILNAVLAEV
jgi:type I restriction enzyme S subunit